MLSSFWFRVCVFPDRVLDLLSASVFLFCSLQDLFFDVFRFFFAFIFKVVLLCDLFVISYFASWLVINICVMECMRVCTFKMPFFWVTFTLSLAEERI